MVLDISYHSSEKVIFGNGYESMTLIIYHSGYSLLYLSHHMLNKFSIICFVAPINSNSLTTTFLAPQELGDSHLGHPSICFCLASSL